MSNSIPDMDATKHFRIFCVLNYFMIFARMASYFPLVTGFALSMYRMLLSKFLKAVPVGIAKKRLRWQIRQKRRVFSRLNVSEHYKLSVYEFHAMSFTHPIQSDRFSATSIAVTVKRAPSTERMQKSEWQTGIRIERGMRKWNGDRESRLHTHKPNRIKCNK